EFRKASRGGEFRSFLDGPADEHPWDGVAPLRGEAFGESFLKVREPAGYRELGSKGAHWAAARLILRGIRPVGWWLGKKSGSKILTNELRGVAEGGCGLLDLRAVHCALPEILDHASR